MIIRTCHKLSKDEVENREKELSEKLETKVVILGPEYGEIVRL